jgi:2-polyprenyl-3-methyl-5-hydroxy-6-metoxy-1,4-benzoquinol methylase
MASISDQKRFYNSEWSIEDRSYPNPYQLKRALAIFNAIAAMKRLRPSICELGAGTGWLTAMLGVIGDAVGIELSDVAVQAARTRFGHVQFECADVLDWDYPREAFDVAISHEVIEHVDDQQRYVDVAYGLLKPGGRLVLTTPNAKAVAAMDPEKRSHQPNEFVLTAQQLRQLLKSRFRRVRVGTLILGGASHGVFRVVNSVRMHRLLSAARLYDAFELTALRAGLGLHLVAVADKI